MLRILLLLLLLGASSAPARAQRPAGAEPPGPTAALAPGAADTGAPPAESAIAHPPRPAAGLRFSLPLPGEDAEILRLLVEGFGATGGTGRTRPGGATGGAEPSGAIGGTHPSGWAGADGGGPAGRGARGARADAAQPASLADAEVRAAFAREWFGRPFRGKLPAEHAVRRRAGFLRLAAATGPEVSFDLASAPREHLLLWGDASHWKERIPGRQHHGGAVGGALLPGGRDARSRLAAGFALRREDWAAWGGNRYPAPGDLRGWRLRASGDRRVVLPGSELVAGAFADFALIETRVCGASGCASPERARARWAIAGARLSSQPARQDQRLWVTGASARPVHDLELGLAATDDRDSGSLARGRWRGDAGIGLRVGREDVVAVLGAGGGGEGSDHAFGPALDIRVRRREQGLLIALEMAPRVVFAEEALAAEELLPPADLLRAAPFAAARPALPESPGLVAARRPPARAWPRLACEALWQAGAGWALAEATLARLRDPLDWAPDTLGGVELYRTVAGPERTFWRLALAADRAVTRGVRAAGRYRWVRADAARAGLEPALLPEHRLAAELRGAAGDWRWGVGLDWRGGASAGAGRRRLAGSFDLSASAGRALGPGELRLEVENLFADRLALRPNEVLSERRVGLVWRHAWSAR